MVMPLTMLTDALGAGIAMQLPDKFPLTEDHAQTP